jgi:4-hydroxy-tetrahydrodipicolinate synthase
MKQELKKMGKQRMKNLTSFSGVYPMLFALFETDGLLSRQAMRKQVKAAIKHRPHGIAILGLASEVNKLAYAERRTLLEWVAEDNAGELPLAVTVAEPSIASQIEFISAAKAAGADWVILQPPPVPGASERELVRFFGAVAEKSTLPVGLQIAPQYLGSGMSADGLLTLNRNHPNVCVLKLETTAFGIARLGEATGGRFTLFNGRAGVEMVESLKAGAVGIIPGGECYDRLAKIYNQVCSSNPNEQRSGIVLYQELLPLLIMLMDSIDTFLTHAKPLLCQRLAIAESGIRSPSSTPTEFGQQVVRQYAEYLGPL